MAEGRCYAAPAPRDVAVCLLLRSRDGGATWDTISEGTASHPGGSPDQTIDVPEVTIAVSPGHQFRISCGPSGTFGLVSYGNDPNRTFLRFEWGA